MLHLMEESTAPAASSTFLGILYAEDFDDPPPAAAPEPSAAESAAPKLTQDDLDAACAAAVVAARHEWEASQEQRRADLLATVSAAMAGARDASEKAALAVAEGTVATLLAMLSGILPRLCSDHGPAEVRALVHRLLPTLRGESRVTIRVHAELVHELKRGLADLEPDLADAITILPAAIQRGDVKVSWENGSMSRDTRQIHQAMQDVLGQLGLQQPIETSPKRSMAHAE